MRTTLDLPDPLLRELKAKAALRGISLKTLLRELLEGGLNAPPTSATPASRSALPTISIGQPLPRSLLSNASLFELVNEDR